MKRTETREMQILRSARKKAGFSQMQLAIELDMQVRQYQRFEYGEESFSSVNIKTGLKICRILQLDPFDLVLGDSCGTQMMVSGAAGLWPTATGWSSKAGQQEGATRSGSGHR